MPEHKYADLAAKLREEIQSGVYAAGQKLPSENELTALTGYSRQTVRQAMGLLEKDGLTDRVRGSGTYVRSGPTRRAVTHNVAVVTTYIGEYIFPDILQGIDRVLSQNGYSPLLSATHNRMDTERQILTGLLDKPIDGLIVEGTKTALPNPNLDLYRQFAAREMPVVFINGFYRDLKDPIYVVADDRAGGRSACELLLKQGHREIAGLFKSDDIQGHRRYQGYVEALRSAGVAVTDDRVLWYTTEDRDAIVATRVGELVRDCTGLVCYNDEAAIQVLRALGDRTPALASFDNSTVAQMLPIPFVSLSNPKERIGALAAEKLLRLLDGKEEASTILPWNLEPSRPI